MQDLFREARKNPKDGFSPIFLTNKNCRLPFGFFPASIECGYTQIYQTYPASIATDSLICLNRTFLKLCSNSSVSLTNQHPDSLPRYYWFSLQDLWNHILPVLVVLPAAAGRSRLVMGSGLNSPAGARTSNHQNLTLAFPAWVQSHL